MRRVFTAILAIGSACLMTSCATHRRTDRASHLSSEIGEYYRNTAGVEAVKTEQPEIYDGGLEIRKKMLELINEATDYILIDSFLVTSIGPALDVLDALKAKQDEGVRVYILTDFSVRYVPEEDAFAYLEEIGIPYAEYNPLTVSKLILMPVLLARDHRKFWVVDGKVLFLGGANINESSLTSREDGGNRDFMIAVKSPEAVSEMISAFVKTWNRSSSMQLKQSDFAVQGEPSKEVRMWLFNQQFEGETANVVPMVDGLFAMAQKEIWILQAYAFVNPDLIKMIKTASERGVSVNFVFGEPVRYQRFRYASYYGIKNILKAGGKVWVCESGTSPLHYKSILVDDNLVEMGSANLNFRSYHLSKETNLVIEDKVSARKIRGTLQEFLKNSRQVTREEAKQYRGLRYSLGWLLMQFGG